MAFTTSNPFMRPMRAQPKKPKQPKQSPYGFKFGFGSATYNSPFGTKNLVNPAQSTGVFAKPPTPPAAPKPPADPRDALYLAEVADIESQFQRQFADLEAQGKYDRLAHQTAMSRLLERKPEDIQNTREAANRQGLFFSGKLGKAIGDIELEYARRAADMQAQFDLQERLRANALDELTRTFGEGGTLRTKAYWDAVERAIQRDQEFGVPLDEVPEAGARAAANSAQAAPQPPTPAGLLMAKKNKQKTKKKQQKTKKKQQKRQPR